MLPKSSVGYDYDQKFDVLYIALGDRRNSYGDDSDGKVIYLKDIDTDELTGVTILNFKKKFFENALPVFQGKLRSILKEAESAIC